jgi:hypothetical protein
VHAKSDEFEDIWAEIVRETALLKTLSPGVDGCRFLYSSRDTFDRNTGLLIAGINPGREEDMRDRSFAENGRNAYLGETWSRSPYQLRIKALMEAIYRHFGVAEADLEAAINQTLTANFMPFRSNRSSDIRGEAGRLARSYSTDLWCRILPKARVRAVVCSGDLAFRGFSKVCSKVGLPVPSLLPHASTSDWGPWCIEHAIEGLVAVDFAPTWPVLGHT